MLTFYWVPTIFRVWRHLIFVIPFDGWIRWGAEKLNTLPNITQVVDGLAGIKNPGLAHSTPPPSPLSLPASSVRSHDKRPSIPHREIVEKKAITGRSIPWSTAWGSPCRMQMPLMEEKMLSAPRRGGFSLTLPVSACLWEEIRMGKLRLQEQNQLAWGQTLEKRWTQMRTLISWGQFCAFLLIWGVCTFYTRNWGSGSRMDHSKKFTCQHTLPAERQKAQRKLAWVKECNHFWAHLTETPGESCSGSSDVGALTMTSGFYLGLALAVLCPRHTQRSFLHVVPQQLSKCSRNSASIAPGF